MRHARCGGSAPDPKTRNMSDKSDDLPLTMADLERVRSDLQASIRHTEEMLQRTESLLIAAALLKNGVAIRLLQFDGPFASHPPPPPSALDSARISTN
jgi:hypothetical protein